MRLGITAFEGSMSFVGPRSYASASDCRLCWIARLGPTTPTRAGKSYALTPTAVVALVGSISTSVFFKARMLNDFIAKKHSDGFVYSSGQPVEDDDRLP
jgi:hypothetical protein